MDGGNYEVIRRRLVAQGKSLRAKADLLNEARTEIFGSSKLEVVANARVRTEHNCRPQDIVQVQGCLLFGYNVFLGLKREASIADVFSLQRMVPTDGGVDFEPVLEDDPAAEFLRAPEFARDFTDLYKYYRETRLQQLRAMPQKLLAVFRYGPSPRDLRVFQWNVLPNGELAYIDNRGEREHTFPPQHDFEWVATTRDDHVQGRHPHVSILDKVFVETVGGDLTVKVEDNTGDGHGIYRELVDDANQTLDDARVEYAALGGLIVMRIRPYNEDEWRYLIFNTRTKDVQRVDAIGVSCLTLPEDHGIVFPGGTYLQTGEYKQLGGGSDGLIYKRTIRSPNGEDVLYVYYDDDGGDYMLLPYNLIRKEVDSAITCHGYSLFGDGRLAVFRDDGGGPTKVHPMQVWQTAFTSVEQSSAATADSNSKLARIGNAELVRGISDVLTICRLIAESSPTREVYEALVQQARRVVDGVYWFGDDEVGDLKTPLTEVRLTSELIIDEFEKVVALRKRAKQSLAAAEKEQGLLLTDVRADVLKTVDAFMDALTRLRTQRGHLITLKDVRYIDVTRVDSLEEQIVERDEDVSHACVDVLLDPAALSDLSTELQGALTALDTVQATRELNPIVERLDAAAGGLEVLSDVVANLDVDDPTSRTTILGNISEVYGLLNRVRASAESRRTTIGSAEGRAEFSAQFTLFSQSVSSALALSDSPERCDEQLSRLLLTLEELEGRFGEFDEFLGDLADKRDEVYQAFEAKKQQLVDARQRRASNLLSAADRMLQGIRRRAQTLEGADALNAYFAADGLVMKLRGVADQLVALGDSVRSDELLAKLKAAQQESMRGMRDRAELFEDGNLIKLGKHRFSVNTQPLELTMVPHDGAMRLHLSGTDFYSAVQDPDFAATEPLWDRPLVSESTEVYRGEFLAASIWFAAVNGEGALTRAGLDAARREGTLEDVVRGVAVDRYDEGYDRGVHDSDATTILATLLDLDAQAGLLRFGGRLRASCALFVQFGATERQLRSWRSRAGSLARVQAAFGDAPAMRGLRAEIGARTAHWLALMGWPFSVAADEAGAYLAAEWGQQSERIVASGEASEARQGLELWLNTKGQSRAFADELAALREFVSDAAPLADETHGDEPASDLVSGVLLVHAWLEAVTRGEASAAVSDDALIEAAVWYMTDDLDRDVQHASIARDVSALRGAHKRIEDGVMNVRLDETLERLGEFRRTEVPAYRAYRALRKRILSDQRVKMRIGELTPRVMTAFVRNRLIDQSYLPLIGDNLAKQIGASGAAKRTDLMGLLLLVSPPGYGKTTLMEYVASRLGLAFVKVNGPSLGHGVVSLDPEEAPNATARQEVDKVNLALEMGNNVMLYVDDIQHTNPEFLQKFISLCDATRRIEGVWEGRTRTYDMRGKKFCVVMAGNPYTESGDRFEIPDMLANRADIYNLGDVLTGRDDVFASSYIENALTSSGVLAPIAARGLDDIYTLMKVAEGHEEAANELQHALSAVEVDEAVRVIRHAMQAREVLLRVNAEYIRSAAQADDYRMEPPFKLQGSYRNMNKIVEKIVPAMNPVELQALIDDHYVGEAQTLTVGAEQNLLKLAELRDRSSDVQAKRWADIKREYTRRKQLIGDDDDPVARVTSVLSGLTQGVDRIGEQLGQHDSLTTLSENVARIEDALRNGGSAAEVATALSPALQRIALALSAPPTWVDAVTDSLAASSGQINIDLTPLVQAMRQIDSRIATGQLREAKRHDALQEISARDADVPGALTQPLAAVPAPPA
ncbi:MAG: MoxR-like ATPase, partial [Bradymonadia bacterium]